MNRGIRFTDEFKQDAVAQVVERGYAVSEVAERLGISTKSLYTWKARFAKSPSVRSEVAKLSLSVTTSRLSGMFRWKAPRLPSLQASPAAATLRHKAGNRTKEGVPIFGAPLHLRLLLQFTYTNGCRSHLPPRPSAKNVCVTNFL